MTVSFHSKSFLLSYVNATQALVIITDCSSNMVFEMKCDTRPEKVNGWRVSVTSPRFSRWLFEEGKKQVNGTQPNLQWHIGLDHAMSIYTLGQAGKELFFQCC